MPFLVLVSATSSSAKDFNRFSQSDTPAYVREVGKSAEKVNANALWAKERLHRFGNWHTYNSRSLDNENQDFTLA